MQATASTSTEHAAPAQGAGKNLRVFMLGCRGAGKTTFLSGLAWLAGGKSKADFKLVYSNQASARVFTDIEEFLRRRVWVPSTLTMVDAEFVVVHAGVTMNFTWLDYPGEDLRKAMESLDFLHRKPIETAFRESNIVLIAVDPTQDIYTSITQASSAEVERRQNALVQAVNQLEHGPAGDSADDVTPQRKRRKIALTITKSDLFPDGLDSAELNGTVLENNCAFLQRLGAESGGNLFALSAVGHTDAGDDGRRIPPSDPSPRGYEELFGWIAKAHSTLQWEMRLPYLLGSLAIVGSLCVAGWFGLQSHRHTIADAPLAELPSSPWPLGLDEHAFHERFLRDLEGLRLSLKSGPDRPGVERVGREAEIILNHRAADPFIGKEARILLSEASEKGGSALWVSIQAETDPKIKKTLLSEYVRTYPDGAHFPEAKRLLVALLEIVKTTLQSDLRALRITGPGALREKATKARVYLDTFATPDQKKEIGLATELAERLLGTGTLQINVTGFGCQGSSDRGLVVILDRSEVLNLGEGGRGSFSSSAGASVQFDLWDYVRINEIVASYSMDILGFITYFDGSTRLSLGKGTPDWKDSNPWVSLQLVIPGWSGTLRPGEAPVSKAHLEAYGKYFTPGNAW